MPHISKCYGRFGMIKNLIGVCTQNITLSFSCHFAYLQFIGLIHFNTTHEHDKQLLDVSLHIPRLRHGQP